MDAHLAGEGGQGLRGQLQQQGQGGKASGRGGGWQLKLQRELASAQLRQSILAHQMSAVEQQMGVTASMSMQLQGLQGLTVEPLQSARKQVQSHDHFRAPAPAMAEGKISGEGAHLTGTGVAGSGHPGGPSSDGVALGKRDRSELEGAISALQQPDTAKLLLAAIAQQQSSMLTMRELCSAVSAAQAQPPDLREGSLVVCVHLLQKAKAAAAAEQATLSLNRVSGNAHDQTTLLQTALSSDMAMLPASVAPAASWTGDGATASRHVGESAGEASHAAKERPTLAQGNLLSAAEATSVSALARLAASGSRLSEDARPEAPSAFARVRVPFGQSTEGASTPAAAGLLSTTSGRDADLKLDPALRLASVGGTAHRDEASANLVNLSGPPDAETRETGASLTAEQAAAILQMVSSAQNDGHRYLRAVNGQASSLAHTRRRPCVSIRDGHDLTRPGEQYESDVAMDAEGMASITSVASLNSTAEALASVTSLASYASGSSGGSRGWGLSEQQQQSSARSPQPPLRSIGKCRRNAEEDVDPGAPQPPLTPMPRGSPGACCRVSRNFCVRAFQLLSERLR